MTETKEKVQISKNESSKLARKKTGTQTNRQKEDSQTNELLIEANEKDIYESKGTSSSQKGLESQAMT